jgi:hypothetical protein
MNKPKVLPVTETGPDENALYPMCPTKVCEKFSGLCVQKYKKHGNAHNRDIVESMPHEISYTENIIMKSFSGLIKSPYYIYMSMAALSFSRQNQPRRHVTTNREAKTEAKKKEPGANTEPYSNLSLPLDNIGPYSFLGSHQLAALISHYQSPKQAITLPCPR